MVDVKIIRADDLNLRHGVKKIMPGDFKNPKKLFNKSLEA